MKLLVCLKVKYGFPVEAVLGFLDYKDKLSWEEFLEDYYYEICVCPDEGHIYLLIRDCKDAEKVTSGINNLPLVKEGFLEFQVHQFDKFKTLDKFFGHRPYLKV